MSSFKKWPLSDFCGIYGRVVPHYLPDGKHFKSFYCSNRYDDTPTINVDESLGEIQFFDLFGYDKSIVKIDDDYILCTNEKADFLEMEHRSAEVASQTSARITRDMQDTSYKAYEKCKMYATKIKSLFFNPVMLQNRYSLICKEDCLYPTCPFYSKWAIDNRAFQHKEDYDEWIEEAYKNLK